MSKGYDRRGFFGDIIHYDENGHKTGVSRQNFWGGYNDYDASGKKLGSSMRNLSGGFNHYDRTGHKTCSSEPAFFGGMNHYDNEGNKVGHSDPTFIDGWDYRKERMQRAAISANFEESIANKGTAKYVDCEAIYKGSKEYINKNVSTETESTAWEDLKFLIGFFVPKFFWGIIIMALFLLLCSLY